MSGFSSRVYPCWIAVELDRCRAGDTGVITDYPILELLRTISGTLYVQYRGKVRSTRSVTLSHMNGPKWSGL